MTKDDDYDEIVSDIDEILPEGASKDLGVESLKRYITVRDVRDDMVVKASYHESTANEILAHLVDGCTREASARLAGITANTLYYWMDTYPDFNEGVKRAEAIFKKICEQNVIEAGRKYWQASAWILERRFSDDYAQRQKIEATIEQAYKEFTVQVMGVIEEIDPNIKKEVATRLQKRLT